MARQLKCNGGGGGGGGQGVWLIKRQMYFKKLRKHFKHNWLQKLAMFVCLKLNERQNCPYQNTKEKHI